ncbi:MAG: glycosyltransferase [Hyphomonadaceae bacterium]|nr:glycosyltransferase [Hyphomonadaceae bacterium]
MLLDAKTAPLVAIVTPVYNGAEFLAETMESVQAQTYPNLVHIVLDNASTDATPEIIARFKAGRVPLVTARNPTLLSMDQNWNAALALIPGEAKYFRILCADDVIFPETTLRMVALAESDPAIAVVTTALLRNDQEEDFRWPRDRTVFDGVEALRRYFTIQGTIEARQALMRTRDLASAAPFFDLNVGHSSDIDAVLRLLAPGRLGFLHEPLGMVREHEGNASSAEMRPTHAHFNDWLITLRRHAPRAFDASAYAKLERRYWRFYLRRLLRWRFVHGNRRAWDLHMQLLAKQNNRPSLIDYADAALDLVFEKFGLRQGWYAYPA